MNFGNIEIDKLKKSKHLGRSRSVQNNNFSVSSNENISKYKYRADSIVNKKGNLIKGTQIQLVSLLNNNEQKNWEIKSKATKFIDQIEQEMKKNNLNALSQTSLEERLKLIGTIIQKLFSRLFLSNNNGYTKILENFFRVYFTNPYITESSQCLNNFCTLGIHWDLVPKNRYEFDRNYLMSKVLKEKNNKIVSRNERQNRWNRLSNPKENTKQLEVHKNYLEQKIKTLLEKKQKALTEETKLFPKEHGEHTMYGIPNFLFKTEKNNKRVLIAKDQRYKSQPLVYFKLESDGLFYLDVVKSESHWQKTTYKYFYLKGRITNVYVLHDLD